MYTCHEMNCHDLEVMSSNPGRFELGVHSTSICPKSYLNQKYHSKFHILVFVFQWWVRTCELFPQQPNANNYCKKGEFIKIGNLTRNQSIICQMFMVNTSMKVLDEYFTAMCRQNEYMYTYQFA